MFRIRDLVASVRFLLLLVVCFTEVRAWQERKPGRVDQKRLLQESNLETRGGYIQTTPPTRRCHFNYHIGLKSTLAPPTPPHVQHKRAWSTRLSPLTDGDGLCRPSLEDPTKQVEKTSSEVVQKQGPMTDSSAPKSSTWTRLDVSLCFTYFCNMVALTLPVILTPQVAAEHVASSVGQKLSVATMVATIASIATLGGGLGKVLNGFICQNLGGSRSSMIYLVALASGSFLLSTSNAEYAGWVLAFMEFCASIQWTACNLILANHYGKDPAKYAKGITTLSLASTCGTILAKIGGTTLLKFLPWRSVAQLGGVMALVGAVAIRTVVKEKPPTSTKTKIADAVFFRKEKNKQSIVQSCKAVMGHPLFWQVGIAHAMHTLMRQSDRILGVFFHQTTSLPRAACGGLTVFATIGFVHGLIKSQQFYKLKDVPSKIKMVTQAYKVSIVTSIAMALCANQWIQDLLFPSKHILAASVALMSGIIASNLSFQFYQIPAMVATAFFGKNKAVCLSLLDGVGFVWTAAIWGVTGKIVASTGPHGWTLVWLMLAGMFGAGGLTTINVLPSVLKKQQQQSAAA